MTMMIRNLNIGLLIIIMSTFSISGWCGSECLKLYDDEIQGRNFLRVFNVLTDFYAVNKESIQILNNEKFFIDDNYKTSSNNIKIALNGIYANRNTTINQDYSSPRNFKVLKNHLGKINECLKNTSQISDLKACEVQSLHHYIIGLRKIIEALSYEYPNSKT